MTNPQNVVHDPLDEDVDHDFDAAWAERAATAPRVRILGKVYTLPVSMPAKVILFATQMQGVNKDAQVKPTVIVDMLSAMLSRSAVEELFDKGLDVAQMNDILSYCMQTLRGSSSKGEGEAPTTGATPTTLSD